MRDASGMESNRLIVFSQIKEILKKIWGTSLQGRREGGTMTPGPIEITLRNQHVEPEDLLFLFFFLEIT